jgi:hypothetical protein
LPFFRLSSCEAVSVLPSGTVHVPLSPFVSGMMTGERTPTGPSWMCATVASMLLVFTVPEIAPLSVSMVKTAVPVANVVTGGVSCAPLREADFTTIVLGLLSVPPQPDAKPITAAAEAR